jgi:ubiquinone/menaquinone biosynthesis C-methylase UbiE
MTFTLPGKFVVPEIVATQFFLKEGDVVADYGAGSGYFLKVLTQGVGPSGKVYACEIQKALVDKLGDFARLNGLTNVTPLWCDLEELGGIKISDNSIDVGLLVNTLFMFEQKATAVREIRRTLRPGAFLHVIDWTESFGGIGPQSANVITKEAATILLESEGFALEREYPTGEHHYGLAFRKL